MADKIQQVIAGNARSASMTASQRKTLATTAAHARWQKRDGVRLATHEGEWLIGGINVPCAVLDDGTRVFSERGLSKALGHVRSGSEYKRLKEQPPGDQLPVFIGKNVASFLPEESRKKLGTPIRYRHADNFSIPAKGIPADLLPEIFDAFLSARDAGLIVSAADKRRVDAAEKLMRALAKVGVVAIVDEATGYQFEREKGDLQRLLEKYVTEEYRPWTSTFPADFYREMFRLRKVTTGDVRKRPQYFGRLTNDIVYDRLLPGVLERLRNVNPVNESGRRSRAHHQHFSDNTGAEHLRQHLANVVFLMKASSDWDRFMRALDRAAPKRGTQIELDLSDGE